MAVIFDAVDRTIPNVALHAIRVLQYIAGGRECAFHSGVITAGEGAAFDFSVAWAAGGIRVANSGVKEHLQSADDREVSQRAWLSIGAV